MRDAVNLWLCALAASHAVQAQGTYGKEQTSDEDLLTDINVISRYWGTFKSKLNVYASALRLTLRV